MFRIKIIFAALIVFLVPGFVMAANPLNLLNTNVVNDINNQAQYTANGYDVQNTNETTMTQIVADILNVFFGLLGTIFIVLIVVAGYKWMTAAGNDDKVSEALHTIRVAVIGLAIIAAAYAITYFVFSRLPNA